ncbi:hypothetical protein ABZP36_013535 [Zizania latifolia]
MDAAVADGCGVLSLSLGGGAADYAQCPGVLLHRQRSAWLLHDLNVAPWITTVGAGTLDRDFPAYVSLGNGKNYTGVSLYSGKAVNLCMPGTLTLEKVVGKIVICDRGVSARVQKGLVVRDTGDAGMVLSNTAANGQELVVDAHLLPAGGVGAKEGTTIKAYVASDPNPTATIVVAGTQVNVHPSPVVAVFSSRRPNMLTPQILKPDIIAPGVNILAV